MPLTPKGKKIMDSMIKTYGKKEAERIFNAMVTEKKLHKVHEPKKRKK